MKRSPEEIKNIVHKVFEQLSTGQEKGPADWSQAAQAALSEKEKKHVRFAGQKEKAVFFNVDSSAWCFQMNLRKPQILAALQQHDPHIQKIVFKIGKVL